MLKPLLYLAQILSVASIAMSKHKEQCWASCLGDCAGGISGEHYISEGIFESGSVTVQGFDWCKDEPKTIGLASFTRNILCRKHNSALSPVDIGGINAFKTFEQFSTVSLARQEIKPRRASKRRYRIDGPVLERWFLKTLINLASVDSHPIGSEEAEAGRPADHLVRLAFGLESFKEKEGLLLLAQPRGIIHTDKKIEFAALIHRQHKFVSGAHFRFFGYPFVLNLRPRLPEFSVIDRLKWHRQGVPPPVLLHHPHRILDRPDKLSQVVQFDW